MHEKKGGMRQDGFQSLKNITVAMIKTSASAHYAKLKPGETEAVLPVRDAVGLFMRVRLDRLGDVVKEWIVRAVAGDDIRTVIIGESPGMSLVAARKVGACVRDEIARTGIARVPYVRSKFANYIAVDIVHLMKVLKAVPKPACFEVTHDPADAILFRFDATLVLALIEAKIPYEVLISRED